MAALKSLPPVPSTYVPETDGYVGTYSVVALRAEQAGLAFYNVYEREEVSADSAPYSEDAADGDTSSQSSPQGTHGFAGAKRKKGFKDSAGLSARVRKVIDEEQDLYELLASDPSASTDEIKKQYKRLALIFHPDKKFSNGASTEGPPIRPDPSKMTDEQIKLHFLKIQNAMEILIDEVNRKQYDSSLPFDDDLPSANDLTPQNFYEVCGAAFKKESKWSSVKPTPSLGDESTPIEQVKRFYKFWSNDFISWRDFSNHGEFDLDEAQDREERRWMQKENWKVVSKFIKQERLRVLRFVTMVEGKDPRILAEKEAERARREVAKAERYATQHAAQIKATEEKRRREEEARVAQETADKIALEKKRLEKKRITDLRKRIRGIYRPWCEETSTLCEFTSADLQEYCVNAPMNFLVQMADALSELVADIGSEVDPKDHPQVCSEISKTIRSIMSEWNNSRYKTSLVTSKSAPAVSTTNSLPAHVWTADEMSMLSKGLVKYPGGTQNRWVQIAKFLGEEFTADDVIAQTRILTEAKNLRTSQDPRAAFEQSQNRIPDTKKKIDSALDLRDPSTVPDWTNEQQNALEQALARHPPTGNPQQRWTDIALEVPGKNAKDCLVRFKEIRDAIIAAQKVGGRT